MTESGQTGVVTGEVRQPEIIGLVPEVKCVCGAVMIPTNRAVDYLLPYRHQRREYACPNGTGRITVSRNDDMPWLLAGIEVHCR